MKITIAALVLLTGCISGDQPAAPLVPNDPANQPAITESLPERDLSGLDVQHINTGNTRAEDLVRFAESLKGIRYRYGSSDPRKGFDCSGFITYVFKRFNIQVPRSSEGFTSVEREIPLSMAKRGDIILFTGTDSTKRVVGHMGIITERKPEGHEFIHSTSGKAYGVTVTPLNKYYQGRFVKAIRIFD